MNAKIAKKLGNSKTKQGFFAEVEQILAPYGQVKRSQLLVEKNHQKSEVSCFVEMETPQQAIAARNSLNMLLMGSAYLFFCVKIRADFIE